MLPNLRSIKKPPRSAAPGLAGTPHRRTAISNLSARPQSYFPPFFTGGATAASYSAFAAVQFTTLNHAAT